MADRRRDNNRRNDNNDEEGWSFGNLLGGALAAGAVAAAGYGIYRAVQGAGSTETRDEERYSHRQPIYSSSPPRTSSYNQRDLSPLGPPLYHDGDDDSIVIAVDATERRAGGLLILPNSEQIYFYSIDWSNIFKFPRQPDKFEMVNALLALEIFKSYVKKYRESGEEENDQSLFVKTDNTFSTSKMALGAYPGLGNEKWRKLYNSINDTLQSEQPFLGEWKYVDGTEMDMQMKMADKLSRNDYSASISLPQLTFGSGLFDHYEQENISNTDYAVVHTLAMKVPDEIKF